MGEQEANPTLQNLDPTDPWSSLSVIEDDLAPPVSSSSALTPSPETFEGELAVAPTEVDEEAHLTAETNEAAVQAAVAEAQARIEAAPTRGGAFTIPLLCAGIAIIAACLLIPQADANRRLAYERVKLQADLETVEKQVET